MTEPRSNRNRLKPTLEDLEAASVEFVGTTIFLLLAFGGVQAAQLAKGPSVPPTVDFLFFAAASFGLGVLAGVWIVANATGGLLNPAVTLAFFLTRKISPVRFVLYFTAQILAGMTAAGIMAALTPGPLSVRNELGAGVNRTQGLFIEFFATAIFVMSVLMLAAEKHAGNPVAPIGIGMTLFVCHLWCIRFSGAGLNPARSFGPAVVQGFQTYQWIYWVGPLGGAVLASAIYAWLTHTHYRRFGPNKGISTSAGDEDSAEVASKNDASTSTNDASTSGKKGVGTGSKHKRMASDATHVQLEQGEGFPFH